MSYLFLELQAYSESCRRKEKQPCGRWMLYMYHRRSHMDAATGSMLSEQHIYQQELEGFSQAQIQSFFDRVNYSPRMSTPTSTSSVIGYTSSSRSAAYSTSRLDSSKRRRLEAAPAHSVTFGIASTRGFWNNSMTKMPA